MEKHNMQGIFISLSVILFVLIKTFLHGGKPYIT